jgi:NAD+ synthase (glutamine-hydrolysing)
MSVLLHGFCRVAALVPELALARPEENARRQVALLRQAVDEDIRVVVFPELALTGYTCGDLFYQSHLLRAAREALREMLQQTKNLPLVYVTGLPWPVGGRLYNCAAVCSGGRLLGLVPKIYLPQRREFYEARWFCPGNEETARSVAGLLMDSDSEGETPFGTDLLFATDDGSFCFGVEICEDLWAPEPPSGALALAGAELILNPSASPELLGKAAYRRALVAQQSARLLAGYVYASAGPGESTADLLYGGHALVAENGRMLAESERFALSGGRAVADLDVEFLRHERQLSSSFAQAPHFSHRIIRFPLAPPTSGRRSFRLLQAPEKRPFVPGDPAARADNCREILGIQSTALAARLRHTGLERVVLGLSGGLDSTLALLVCWKAFSLLEKPIDRILGVTMPGLGTTERTKNNARRAAELLGVDLREIPIGPAVAQHLSDLGHPADLRDVTLENAQARERTQILMDLANQQHGMVVGTGDLSEAALGWCTFNGDHMSMFHVNAGVPKTLVQYLIGWCAEEWFEGELADVLRDIIATPISPELLPLAEDGSQAQETEAVIGPYEVHDFLLFHVVRRGAAPEKARFLLHAAFAEEYPAARLDQWMEIFYRRFFAAQFKRNTLPDGPKVGTVALSPRGDWRMPSDARPDSWLGR